ncbi:replication factor C subunit 4 [Planoprotostelium fungivorum]|uniref:Replication factor C subunit 4 n=1 Tax=Planoprotostelium fungivorum TaxID=1890364 RepID=A0A2P6N3D2_9EUKA|nr:replication factor C subunit 4 [Planoprotostelium fungivorum]
MSTKRPLEAPSSKSGNDRSDSGAPLPWVEKYRPKSVDEVSYQEEVVNTLRASIERTGKTSTILAIGRQLYGDLFKSRVKELNASDERGINVVRTSIKAFAQVATSASTNASGKTIPPYKLIILDEADAMTQDAQAALRRTMETYSKTTRFCLICNYVSRIIEPLASRCAKFRFKSLTQESMEERIKYICDKEGIRFTQELGNGLSQVSGGDLRRAINLLQSAHSMYKEDTNAAALFEVAGKVPEQVVEGLIEAAQSNSFDTLESAVTETIANGYPASQIVSQLFDVITDGPLRDLQKAKIAEVLASSDKALQEGADEFLQLMNVFSVVMQEASR